jgi:hypothetical protein
MLCSSPISTSMLLNQEISEGDRAGMNRPAIAINVKRPHVFSVTVFPPVFGPVMTSVLNVLPSSKSIGTTRSVGIRGCLAFRNTMTPELFIKGMIASIASASRAFDIAKSSSAKIVVFVRRTSAFDAAIADSSFKIERISCCSAASSSRILLLSSTTAIGSIKSVLPLADVSCTSPLTAALRSERTGTT